MTPERVARHEAAHAAMAVLLGVPVRCVGVQADGGYVTYGPHTHTRKGAISRMMILLAALIETADSGADLPGWPIDHHAGSDAERGDWQLLAELADRLALTESEYRDIERAVFAVVTDRDYQQLVTGISGLLDYTPRVGPELIAALQRRV